MNAALSTNGPRIFAQIHKVDEAKRTVIGRATDEGIDAAGEAFDYDSSKPLFQAWSADVHRASAGKSLGNVREMHNPIAAGKLTHIEFDDTNKAIDVEAYICDDASWTKILDGVLTGFSIGGKYTKRWNDISDGKPITRYTASPNEISLVDRPCNPNSKFYDILKTDGTLRKVAFQNSTETDMTYSVRKQLQPAFGKTAARMMIESALDGGAALSKVFGAEVGGELTAAIHAELIKQAAQDAPGHPEIVGDDAQRVFKALRAMHSHGPTIQYMASMGS